MKKGKVALITGIAVGVVAAGVAVVGFTALNSGNSGKKSAQLADKSMAASVRTQIEKPLALTKGEVTNIQKTSDDPDHLALVWDPVTDAKKYNVYLCDKDNSSSFTLYTEVEQPNADITGLQENSVYWIKIAAEINGGECPASLLKTATRVTDVTNLASEHSDDTLGFCWDENPKYDGYNIYRASSGNSNQFELYETINNSKPSYEDNEVDNGELYTYKICPFRAPDKETKIEAAGQTIDLVSGLSSPSGLVGRSANSRIVLYWQDRSVADGYNIYMATGDSTDFQKVDSTEGTSYSTDKLTPGETYTFRVEPFCKMNDKTVTGTWSTCTLKADKAKENVGSSIVGSGTYIEISLVQQHMWFYEDGKLVLDTDVVTGNDDGEHNTPPGSYSIQDRGTNVTLVGEDYETPVEYWMAFNGGIGIHDANWRDAFGGDIYQGDGSHGCVNTPYDMVKIIYDHTEYGTPVYVY